MKTLYYPLVCMLCLAACSSPAQNIRQTETQKKESLVAAVDSISSFQKIYDSILNITVPPYGLDKVEALIGKITIGNPRSTDETRALDPKLYDSLSLPEKFTYNMIHPETYMQLCSMLPMRENEDKRIYGHLTRPFGEFSWSTRQMIFFIEYRDTLGQLMKPIFEKRNKLGGNFKAAIVEMNATGLIPYLIDFYNKEKKDHNILTVLMLLMKKNEYAAFTNSIPYKMLYKQKQGEYSTWLDYNKGYEDLIIQWATKFYDGLPKK